MKNKEKLALILSGLITLNTLGGCSIQNQSMQAYNKLPEAKTIDTTNNLKPSPKIRGKVNLTKPIYTVNTILASVIYNENGDIEYRAPEGCVLIGNMAYQVVVEISYTYPALKTINENGTINYSAPYGGTLSGSSVIVTNREILGPDKTREYLEENGYIQKEDAILVKIPN